MTKQTVSARLAPVEMHRPVSTRKVARGAVIENQAARYQSAQRLMAEDAINVQHFRLQAVVPEGMVASHTGGLTVAFRQLESDSFVEIATAMCSQHDVYNRKVGTILAVEQFANHRRIRVPLFGAKPADAIEHLFRGYLTFVDEE